MRDSSRDVPVFDAKEDDKPDDNVNFFYNTNYIALEDNLEALKERVDEDFYFQEDALSVLIQKMDDMKKDYVLRLDNIEAEYLKILDSGKSVFAQIENSNRKVEEFERMEKHFGGFVNNLRNLETTLAKGKTEYKK